MPTPPSSAQMPSPWMSTAVVCSTESAPIATWTRWASVAKRYALRSNPKSIDGEMAYAAQWYINRFTWMDANIAPPTP